MRKSADAFRTISEVAQDLDLPQHVLRFWETRFTQIKPMKRGGGRRYYRPDDVDLLRGIRHLLYDEGYTIKGVQRILKEQGIRHVIDAVSEGQGLLDSSVLSDPAPLEDGGKPDIALQQSEPNELEVDLPPLVSPTTQPAAQTQQIPVAQTNVTPPPHATPPAPHGHQPSGMHEPSYAPPQGSHNPTSHPAGLAPSLGQPSAHTPAPAQLAPNIGPSNANIHTAMHPVSQEVVALDASVVAEIAASHAVPPTPLAPAPQTNVPVQFQPPIARPDVVPEENELDQSLPHGLVRGDPKFLHGESASISVADGRAQLLEEEQKSGFFTRLRNRADATNQDNAAMGSKGMPRDDIRRLQSTLFELLECKRILDQARSD